MKYDRYNLVTLIDQLSVLWSKAFTEIIVKNVKSQGEIWSDPKMVTRNQNSLKDNQMDGLRNPKVNI